MSRINILTSQVVASIGAGVTASLFTYYILYRYLRRDVMPKKWRRVGVLGTVRIYPLKSGGEISLDAEKEYVCDFLTGCVEGIYDRSLMLVDDENKMITARGYPQLVLVKPTIVAYNKLSFHVENRPDLGVLSVDTDKLVAESVGYVKTDVHGSGVEVVHCGAQYDKCFSQAVLEKDQGLKLVFFPYSKPMKSKCSQLSHEPHYESFDTGALNDATSYHIINLASLNELNTRTTTPVKNAQFRANFEVIMDNPVPYAEDNWKWIKIGDTAIFRNVALCERCIVPNVNITTGTREPQNQPRTVLTKYRILKNHKAPIFGLLLGIRRTGKVKANDVVYVEED